jgi:copper chaperone CopZ
LALNNYILASALKFAKIQVVHSLPGRVRLKLPGLSRFKNDIKDQDESKLIPYKLKGIQKVEVSVLTSKVLITYDENQVTESEIVNWMSRLREILIQKLMAGTDFQSPEVTEEILTALKNDGYEMEKY